ncbi:MAG: hypothetical protein EP343_15085 [Deltaproteobacteria bacterium]|nr:MAG: hypothetical protein EP343_15085 [Deltaproteobacteria bacterium]
MKTAVRRYNPALDKKRTQSQTRMVSQFTVMVPLVLVIISLIVGGSAVTVLWENPSYDWLNFVCLSVFCVACCLASASMVLRNFSTVWTPIPWMLLKVGVFFGFGPLYYFFASDEELAVLDRIWSVGPMELWQTNVVTFVGVLALLVSFLFFTSLMKSIREKEGQDQSETVFMARRLAILFLVMILPLRYLLILPHSFGLFKFVLPGIIMSLSVLIYIVLILVAYLSVHRGGKWRLLFWGLFFTELVVGFLSFSKTALLYVPMTSAIGFFLARRNIVSLMRWSVFLIVLYIGTKPLITHSRAVLRENNANREASFGQRVQIVQRANTDLDTGADGVRQTNLGWWSRLNFAPFQAYAVHQYNEGNSHSTLHMIPYVFVPRIIWRDKPNITDVGADFTEELFGYRTSSTGLGTFGESYWNGGFGMLILVCFYIGLLYSLIAHFSMRFVLRKQWIFLPLVMMSIRMGVDIDGWVVPVFFGGVAIYIAYYVMFYSMHVVFRKYLYKNGKPL